MPIIRKTCFTLGASAIVLAHPDAKAATHTGVQVETTNTYTTCGLGPDLGSSNASGVNFLNEILRVNSAHFTRAFNWQDGNAWNIDYLDNDVPCASIGDDSTQADAPGLAISFYQGHGGDIPHTNPIQTCTTASQCTNPPDGSTPGVAGVCSFTPWSYQTFGRGIGICTYASPRPLITCGNGDSGSSCTTNHYAYFSTGQNVVLGENPAEGAWRGVGTNGGTVLAIFHISHGMDVWFPNAEWQNMYAGVQIVASILVATGDTNDSLAFGHAVAAPYSVNPSGSVGSAYINAISSVTDGGGCPGGLSFGGGINGCGCHVAVSYAATGANATAMLNQSWTSLANPSALATSTAVYVAGLGCNYNPAVYGWSGGG